MKVLLIQSDLYKDIGGGQTVYKKIIEASPDIEFYYFLDKENKNQPRPQNTKVIELKEYRKVYIPNEPIFPQYKKNSIMLADRYAYSVEGMSFDIVDIPDYYDFGRYLKSAFKHNNVNVKRIALAMHGNISKSIELNWQVHDANTMEIHENEYEQFADADFVYSISPAYMREWQEKKNREIYYIDPMHFVSRKFIPYKNNSDKPSIYCIGRNERLKGNDIFIDISRWLEPESYNEAIHIGDDVYLPNGVSASYHLGNLAKEKNMEHKFLPSMDRDQLNKLFNSKALIILPVRYDSLNLIALEALFSGCPVAISTEAGVCEYLDTYYPQVPYCKIEFDNYAESIKNIQKILNNYDFERIKLQNIVKNISLDLDTKEAVKNMYLKCINSECVEAKIYDYTTKTTGCTFFAKKCARKIGLHKLKTITKIRKKLITGKKNIIKNILKAILKTDSLDILMNTYNSMHIIKAQKNISKLPEQNITQINAKLDLLYNACANPIDRGTIYRELCRLLLKTGNDIYALTYILRVLRLKGCTTQEINKIKQLLIELNFDSKVQVVDLFDKDFTELDDNKETYFYCQFSKQLNNKIFDDFEVYEERRSNEVKVSIIISLYNAANKLDFFLSMLSMQKMIQRREAELIFVDSSSPMDEKSIIDKYKDNFEYAFIRTNKRETIQCAWNRGIKLARGEYLSFLGVDEMIFPETLDCLCEILDNEQDVDWVMANSLITKVNKNGIYEESVMTYNRKNDNQNICYLESCYLSYVGGVYRKNIHDRFGYYDATFRGAGDTEFKNRILPYIKVRFVDTTYGIFLDYPEERVTSSPMAEIEDLQAWYAHRTYLGVAYAMQNASKEEIEQLMLLALNYRKSYCSHISSDLEYALNVGRYLNNVYSDSKIGQELVPILEKILNDFRNLEVLPNKKSKFAGIHAIKECLRDLNILKRKTKEISNTNLTLQIFNDNRYEQHSWAWIAPQR